MHRLLAIPSSHPLAHILLVVVCLAAAWTDVREQVISDLVTVPGMILGLLIALATDGTQGLQAAALGAVAGFVIFGILNLAGLMASGDTFLMTAAGSLLGVPSVFTAMVLATVFGVIVAGIWVLAKGQWRRVLGNFKLLGKKMVRGSRNRDHVEPTPFPFGVAIALGSIYTVAAAYLPVLGAPLP